MSKRRRGRRWIKGALAQHRRGALHKDMGLPVGEPITPSDLREFEKVARTNLAAATTTAERNAWRTKLRRVLLAKNLRALPRRSRY